MELLGCLSEMFDDESLGCGITTRLILFPLLYNFTEKKSRAVTSQPVRGGLEEFFDPTETKLLVLPGHPDEVLQAFLKLLWSFSCPIDKPDPDPFVGI